MRVAAIPIVAHQTVNPAPALQRAVEQLAEALLREQPQLGADEQWRPYIPRRLDEGPALHLDDLSEIPLLNGDQDVRFLQDRARLRAGPDDLVASSSEPVDGYEAYCRDQLGLGAVEWLHPARPAHPLRIAAACWEDRHVRRQLVHRMRFGELSYLHPHMGTFSCWELAALLNGASRRPIQVIAPPPAVTAWANDKVQFTDAISRLFGKKFVPRTMSAWNETSLARHVAELSEISEVIGLKLPNSAGGSGIIVLDAIEFRGRRPHEIRQTLQPLLASIAWDASSRLLIDTWETDVLCSPSAQIWIPPESAGLPVLEGLFVQQLAGRQEFVGVTPASFPAPLADELATDAWLVARLFQRVGYIGRCSFDLILVGANLANCRLEFIECNGRWGGTSLPMTLMNRLFNDWQQQPFAVRVVPAAGLDRVTFPQLTHELQHDLYDHRTGQGRLIVYSPGRMPRQSSLTVLALGDSWDDAADCVAKRVGHRLERACRDALAVMPANTAGDEPATV